MIPKDTTDKSLERRSDPPQRFTTLLIGLFLLFLMAPLSWVIEINFFSRIGAWLVVAVLLVDILLAEGADPNARNCRGETPLHLTWQPEVMGKLLNAGADPGARNAEGNTWLCCWYTNGGSPLLLAYADLEAFGHGHLSPLQQTSHGHHGINAMRSNARALLEAGAAMVEKHAHAGDWS